LAGLRLRSYIRFRRPESLRYMGGEDARTPRSRRKGMAAATASSGCFWLISKTRGASGGRPRAM